MNMRRLECISQLLGYCQMHPASLCACTVMIMQTASSDHLSNSGASWWKHCACTLSAYKLLFRFLMNTITVSAYFYVLETWTFYCVELCIVVQLKLNGSTIPSGKLNDSTISAASSQSTCKTMKPRKVTHSSDRLCSMTSCGSQLDQTELPRYCLCLYFLSYLARP